MKVYFDKEQNQLVIDGMDAILIPKTIVTCGDTAGIKVLIKDFNIDCKDIPQSDYTKPK